MISYDLNINEMQTAIELNGQKNVVTTVYWTYVGKDDNSSANFDGSTSLNYDGGDFTPYTSLTKEQVVKWVIDAHGEEYWKYIQNILEARLAAAPRQIPWDRK